VKAGDIDTEALDLNVLDGTVTVNKLHVTVGGVLNEILGPVPLPANTPLLPLDLSFPDL
jgi:hypothetical protein